MKVLYLVRKLNNKEHKVEPYIKFRDLCCIS